MSDPVDNRRSMSESLHRADATSVDADVRNPDSVGARPDLKAGATPEGCDDAANRWHGSVAAARRASDSDWQCSIDSDTVQHDRDTECLGCDARIDLDAITT